MTEHPESTVADLEQPAESIGHKRMHDALDSRSSTLVDDIKEKVAELIDIAEGLKENDPRLSALAMEYFEIAGVLAIKAATS